MKFLEHSIGYIITIGHEHIYSTNNNNNDK